MQRRSFLRSGCMHCLALGAWTGLSAQAQPAAPPAEGTPATAGPLPPRFTRPALDTDEGGLWAMMDREETRLRRSPFVLRDAALTQYLRDLMCRIGGDHCTDIRVHVVRTPHFNANMAPNGMMQVWTGLLLRVENEAQLVAILGHELGHYLERHTLERMRDVKSRMAFAQFMGVFGAAGSLGQLAVLAGAFAFSREHESRADRLGMQLMQRAGYDGREAAAVWENLIAELRVREGDDAGKRSPMMATHPPAADRRDELLRLAGSAGGERNEAPYRRVTAAHRQSWIDDEIRRGQYEESLTLFERLLRRDAADARLLHARGEVYRQRAQAGDAELALADLGAAALAPATDVQAEVHRSLGLLLRQRDERAAAASAFQKYLSLAPQAGDAALIQSYLTELAP